MDNLPTPHIPNNDPQSTNQYPNPIPSSRPSRTKLFVLIGVAVIIATITAIGYALWSEVIPNPFVQQPTAADITQAFLSLDSATITSNIKLEVVPREESVEPLDLSEYSAADEASPCIAGDITCEDELSEATATTEAPSRSPLSTILTLLPSDLKLDLALTSTFAKESENTADAETTVVGTYTSNNITANVDIAFRQVDGKSYVQPNKVPLPIPLFDLQSLSGSWIALQDEGEDETKVFKKIDTEGKGGKDAIEASFHKELQTLFSQALDNGALAYSTAERVSYNNNKVWKVTLVVDAKKFQEAFLEIGDHRDEYFGNANVFTIFDDENVASIKEEKTVKNLQAVAERSVMALYVNKEYIPVAFTFAAKIAPELDAESLSDKQINISLTMEFSNINQPITLTAPADTMNLREAGAKIMGRNEAEQKLDQQRSIINDLRRVLKAYHDENNTYPPTLETLIDFRTDTFEVINIPIDQFTGKSFVYNLRDIIGDYELIYTIEADEDHLRNMIVGTNTATSIAVSKEYETNLDRDEDGLSAYSEAVAGTSDRKIDTDGDGYSDKEELEGGFDPLTNAVTGKKSTATIMIM